MKALLCLLMLLPSCIAMADQSGPEGFGYGWVDNDSAGGPVYNWLDITEIGTQLTGLGDDNNVGPFPLGFDYVYCGNIVSHCWISTNGYISFSSGAYYDPPFEHIPCSYAPNNVVAALGSDLDFTDGNGHLFYYSNNIDTFIVSWLNVSEFRAPDSTNHTFQLILCKSDSSITFQYGYNRGSFQEDIHSEPFNVIGIENSSGTDGLEYLWHSVPNRHLWHINLALRFQPVLGAHDILLLEALDDGSQAKFIPMNIPYFPRAKIANVGNMPETNIKIVCEIKRSQRIIFNSITTVDYLLPGDSIWVTLQDAFLPDSFPSSYKITLSANILWDQNTLNNIKINELDSYMLPQLLGYDDNSANIGRNWDLDYDGFGVEYQVPESIKVRFMSFYVDSVNANVNVYAYIAAFNCLDYPSMTNFIYGDTINVTRAGWYSTYPSHNELIIAPEQKVYAFVISPSPEAFQIGMDRNVPLSNRGWEYVEGVLAPYRYRSQEDIMIRILADKMISGICPYMLGDLNGDNNVTLLDITYGINYFKGSQPPPTICHCEGFDGLYVLGDVNGSCSFNGVDICYMVNYFRGGPALRFCPNCPPSP